MKDSKQSQIEQHLLSGKSITGIQAMALFNVYRLSATILRLRRKMNIGMVMMESDQGVLYGKYFLKAF